MKKRVIKCVTRGALLTALTAVLSTPPSLAAVAGGIPAGLLRLDPPVPPPSSYPRRSGIKATHKIKKTVRHSSIRPPNQ